jgi:hypothetical protein
MNDPVRRHLLMLHRPHHTRGAWHFPPLRVRLAVMGLQRLLGARRGGRALLEDRR